MANLRVIELQSARILVGLVALLSWSCNSSTWSDPFASPPVGQKFYVPANLTDQSDPTSPNGIKETRATFIKLTDRNRANLTFKSITLIGGQGSREIYTFEKIQQNNATSDCKSIERDYADFFRVYPDMNVVCGVEFSKALSEASSVIFATADGKEHEFTSWGTVWSEINEYRVAIQSFTQ